MKAVLRQIGWELRRVLRQRRVWLAAGITVLFQIVFALMVVSPSSTSFLARAYGQFGRTFENHFTALTLANILLASATTFATPIFLAAMAADIAAGENGRGTLRALLCRPVSRSRVLLQKLAAALVVNVGLTFLVAVGALILGHLLLPPGRMFINSADEDVNVVYAYRDGLQLFTWGAAFLAISNLTATALGFFWSCLPIRAAAAAAGALAVMLLESQLRYYPAFKAFWNWFITTRASQWVHVYDPIIDWPKFLGNYGILMTFNVACVTLGCWLFSRRDLKP